MAHIGYIRVSSGDQKADRQLEGITLEKVFEEAVSGANTSQRPVLARCLEYLREGDTLHVHSIDRLARNLGDLKKIVEQLLLKGVEVCFHKENLTFTAEATNPMHALLFHVLGAFAEFERALIKERQREGIAAAKKRGKRLGRPLKITPPLQRTILERLAHGDLPPDLAKEFKVSVTSIYNIRNLLRTS